MEEQHNDGNSEHEDYRPVTIEGLIKVLSILFVLGVYVVIFLKILILK